MRLCAGPEAGQGPDPADGQVIKSIVTTNLVNAGIGWRVLTGFKYIGQQILKEEARQEKAPICFGMEESYGCLIGTYAQDKDAISLGAYALCL